jgi:hypothetical protein
MNRGRVHMNRGRVGEERGGKETDRCPLTHYTNPGIHQGHYNAKIIK